METGTSASRIHFTEVGPRDGLQNLEQELTTGQKLELVLRLLDGGEQLVEATSFSSPRWVPKLADSEELFSRLCRERPQEVRSRIRVLVPNLRGLERAVGAGARRVVANIAATDSFNQRNLNRSTAGVLQDLEAMARSAAASGCRLDVGISVSFGCPFEGRVAPEQVVSIARRLSELGVEEVGIADTIGVADPAAVEALLASLAEAGLEPGGLSLHFHDTRGMGLANSLVAFRAGVRHFEGSVGGIGGCPFAPRATGNICSEDLLEMLQLSGASVPVDLDSLCATASWLAAELGRQLPGSLYRAGRWRGEEVSR